MGKKILVIDNDAFVLEWMRELLTEEGHEVVTAADGLSALDILKDYVPDVVFVDLIMPNISGDKVCRIIRKRPHLDDVYLAVVSATMAKEPARSDLRADAYIAKGPIMEMTEAVLDAVARAGQGRHVRAEGTAPISQGLNRRGITKELLAIQRHLEIILNNISEGILELNIDGKIIYANNAGLSFFGGNEAKILGHPLPDLFDGEDRKKIADLLDDIGSRGPEIINPFVVHFNGETLLLKMLPIEDNLIWYVIVIASRVRESG
ncbi:MAG: response regulator [Deltaproteobacteria bacterium]|nr:response regulator [Deltaproteobacteria bacterium]